MLDGRYILTRIGHLLAGHPIERQTPIKETRNAFMRAYPDVAPDLFLVACHPGRSAAEDATRIAQLQRFLDADDGEDLDPNRSVRLRDVVELFQSQRATDLLGAFDGAAVDLLKEAYGPVATESRGEAS